MTRSSAAGSPPKPSSTLAASTGGTSPSGRPRSTPRRSPAALRRWTRAERVTRLPDGRREVYPSREKTPKRRAPNFGPGLHISVPISFGLPLVVVGIALIVAAMRTGTVILWVGGAVAGVLGVALFASGKRL